MIRYAYICNQVLRLYRDMDELSFPIDPMQVLRYKNTVKFISYQKAAEISECSLDEMIVSCGSSSGCTQYEPVSDRYLVLYNNALADKVPGRIRWTLAHEIGHITLGHFQQIRVSALSEGCQSRLSDKELELEADYFAATLLCPMPLFKSLGISSPADIKVIFGLSAEAANNRWNDYLKWQRGHKKTAFENDLVRLYRMRSQS